MKRNQDSNIPNQKSNIYNNSLSERQMHGLMSFKERRSSLNLIKNTEAHLQIKMLDSVINFNSNINKNNPMESKDRKKNDKNDKNISLINTKTNATYNSFSMNDGNYKKQINNFMEDVNLNNYDKLNLTEISILNNHPNIDGLENISHEFIRKSLSSSTLSRKSSEGDKYSSLSKKERQNKINKINGKIKLNSCDYDSDDTSDENDDDNKDINYLIKALKDTNNINNNIKNNNNINNSSKPKQKANSEFKSNEIENRNITNKIQKTDIKEEEKTEYVKYKKGSTLTDKYYDNKNNYHSNVSKFSSMINFRPKERGSILTQQPICTENSPIKRANTCFTENPEYNKLQYYPMNNQISEVNEDDLNNLNIENYLKNNDFNYQQQMKNDNTKNNKVKQQKTNQQKVKKNGSNKQVEQNNLNNLKRVHLKQQLNTILDIDSENSKNSSAEQSVKSQENDNNDFNYQLDQYNMLKHLKEIEKVKDTGYNNNNNYSNNNVNNNLHTNLKNKNNNNNNNNNYNNNINFNNFNTINSNKNNQVYDKSAYNISTNNISNPSNPSNQINSSSNTISNNNNPNINYNNINNYGNNPQTGKYYCKNTCNDTNDLRDCCYGELDHMRKNMRLDDNQNSILDQKNNFSVSNIDYGHCVNSQNTTHSNILSYYNPYTNTSQNYNNSYLYEFNNTNIIPNNANMFATKMNNTYVSENTTNDNNVYNSSNNNNNLLQIPKNCSNTKIPNHKFSTKSCTEFNENNINPINYNIQIFPTKGIGLRNNLKLSNKTVLDFNDERKIFKTQNVTSRLSTKQILRSGFKFSNKSVTDFNEDGNRFKTSNITNRMSTKQVRNCFRFSNKSVTEFNDDKKLNFLNQAKTNHKFSNKSLNEFNIEDINFKVQQLNTRGFKPGFKFSNKSLNQDQYQLNPGQYLLNNFETINENDEDYKNRMNYTATKNNNFNQNTNNDNNTYNTYNTYNNNDNNNTYNNNNNNNTYNNDNITNNNNISNNSNSCQMNEKYDNKMSYLTGPQKNKPNNIVLEYEKLYNLDNQRKNSYMKKKKKENEVLYDIPEINIIHNQDNEYADTKTFFNKFQKKESYDQLPTINNNNQLNQITNSNFSNFNQNNPNIPNISNYLPNKIVDKNCFSKYKMINEDDPYFAYKSQLFLNNNDEGKNTQKIFNNENDKYNKIQFEKIDNHLNELIANLEKKLEKTQLLTTNMLCNNNYKHDNYNDNNNNNNNNNNKECNNNQNGQNSLVELSDYHEFLEGNVVYIISDKIRSKSLQKIVNRFSDEVEEAIFIETIENLNSILINDYCNYFFQKFFKILNTSQSLKVLEILSKGSLYKQIKSSEGVYVLTSLMSREISNEEINFIHYHLKDKYVSMITDKFAYKFIIKIILKFDEIYLSPIIEEIINNLLFYAQNNYSNEVIKVLLGRNNILPDHMNALCKKIIKNLVVLSKSEISIGIITACLFVSFNLKLLIIIIFIFCIIEYQVKIQKRNK